MRPVYILFIKLRVHYTKYLGRTYNEKSYSKPLFLCNALELKALSGQILIVLDILVLAKEECERDKKYILVQVY